MNPAEVHDLFNRYGAILTGHFRLSSGRHSDTYIQCAHVLAHPRAAFSLGRALAARFTGHVDAVVSPALGGILVGYAVAHELDTRFVFAERADGVFTLRRGQTLARGERVVVVEDVVTTGGSASEVVRLAREAGASVTGVGAIIDRSEAPVEFHLESLLRVAAKSWTAEACPACRDGVPVDVPGSRLLGSRGAS